MMAITVRRCVVGAYVAAGAATVLYFLALDLLGTRLRDVSAGLGAPRASLQRAQAALAADPPEREQAAVDAAAALRADPLLRDGHKTLAQALAGADPVASAALWAGAARFARDSEAQVVALQTALAAGDFAGAVDRIDRLFRGQGAGRWGAVSQALLAVLLAPEAVEPLAARLDERPPWREALLAVAAARLQDLDGMKAFFLAVDRRPNRLTDDEARPLLERLLTAGRYGDAYAIFLARLPAARIESMGYLYNGDFRHPVTNLPFDWVFTRTRDALIDVRRTWGAQLPPVLRVDFFGSRIPFRHVSHLLALPPGAWRFRGLEHAVALNNPRGLRWRVACVGRTEPLGETQLLSGDVEWRPFAMDFEVGPDCPFQWLELELPARVALEMDVSGGVAYMDLAIDPLSQTSLLQ